MKSIVFICLLGIFYPIGVVSAAVKPNIVYILVDN
jgi:hypothetical protein